MHIYCMICNSLLLLFIGIDIFSLLEHCQHLKSQTGGSTCSTVRHLFPFSELTDLQNISIAYIHSISIVIYYWRVQERFFGKSRSPAGSISPPKLVVKCFISRQRNHCNSDKYFPHCDGSISQLWVKTSHNGAINLRRRPAAHILTIHT